MLSLAAGTVLDCDPARTIEVAAAAGFPAAGLWFDPELWTDATTKAVRARLDDTGLIALDIEPVILGRGADPGERLVEAADALDVPFLLCASGPADRGEVIARLGALCEFAGEHAPELTIVLEFLPIFSVGTLGAALSVVEELAAPNLGILVDTLHLSRSGGTPADLAAVSRWLLPYLQIADAPAAAPTDRAALRDEALFGRLLPGEGALPIADVVAAVPDVPLSAELRSSALQERFPDPVERARAVFAASRGLC
jgi:sugar phosphate isomerase/epimerase